MKVSAFLLIVILSISKSYACDLIRKEINSFIGCVNSGAVKDFYGACGAYINTDYSIQDLANCLSKDFLNVSYSDDGDVIVFFECKKNKKISVSLNKKEDRFIVESISEVQ